VHLGDYDYDLPPELIAQVPAETRDAARLLVLERSTGQVRHAAVRELPAFLRPGDLLICNDTRVSPARLHCRAASAGAVELLVLGTFLEGGAPSPPGAGTGSAGTQVWQCLGRPAKRLRPGSALVLPGGALATVAERRNDGRYALRVDATVDLRALLARHGEIPLPPYIKRPDGPLALDRERYQTVFAARDGAVAAPTAGLHFTPALLAALDAVGVQRATVTLAVGPGTFLPVRAEDVREHHMDAEWAEVPAATRAAIDRTKAAGGRVIAVGTTTARALESDGARRLPTVRPALVEGRPSTGSGRTVGSRRPVSDGGFWADAFIMPGFRFRVVDALLTNFHLPRSTLLLLVSAFAGRERMLETYAIAVRERYRFYSYGDAMLIA